VGGPGHRPCVNKGGRTRPPIDRGSMSRTRAKEGKEFRRKSGGLNNNLPGGGRRNAKVIENIGVKENIESQSRLRSNGKKETKKTKKKF